MKATIYEDLKELASCPSETESEEPIRKILIDKLSDIVDSIMLDEIGNMYVFREGSKAGTIGLSAHQDKVMRTTQAGLVLPKNNSKWNTNVIFISPEDISRTLGGVSFICTDQEYSPFSFNNSRRKPHFEGDLRRLGVIPDLKADLSEFIIKSPTPFYSLAGLRDTDFYVSEEFDRILGLKQ